MFSPLASPFRPSLPAHCEPANDFLLQFSGLFHVCIPTPHAFVSNILGILSIVAWLFSQVPQIYKNWRLSSTSGLSFYFLLIWFLGDLSNLIGAILTHQATWQVVMSSYYVFVDICLMFQWTWYEKLRRGKKMHSVWRGRKGETSDWSGDGMFGVVIEGISPASSRRSSQSVDNEAPGKPGKPPKESTKPQVVFHAPHYGHRPTGQFETSDCSAPSSPRNINTHVTGTSFLLYSPSPRTLLVITCLAAMVHATPVNKPVVPPAGDISTPATPLENAGTILSWMSTLLYLGSRVPQLIKNWRRKSTSGLSPQLFAAAFCGNFFYSSALLTNPCAWSDFGRYGEGGWAGPEGSERAKWVRAALPFFLGAAGVLVLDASVVFQFVLYRGNDMEIVVTQEGEEGHWRWRRISGWMRGWIPRLTEVNRVHEREALLGDGRQENRGYGTQ